MGKDFLFYSKLHTMFNHHLVDKFTNTCHLIKFVFDFVLKISTFNFHPSKADLLTQCHLLPTDTINGSAVRLGMTHCKYSYEGAVKKCNLVGKYGSGGRNCGKTEAI